jgi:hypothetical protein
MSPETWEKRCQLRDTQVEEGVHVVGCSPNATGFFTMRESESRLTVSLSKHTEGLDVFA